MKHTLNFGWGSAGSPSNINVVTAVDISDASEFNIDAPIDANQTNKHILFVLTAAQAKLFFIMADQAMTVKTNSTGSPANTFTLLKNVPYVWSVGNGTLTDTAGTTLADVTGLYVTNTTAGTLKIRSLSDPTP